MSEIIFAKRYIEPGYDEPAKGIALANWNNVPAEEAERLEDAGYSLEWSDEWLVVGDGIVRNSPDSYHWEPAFMLCENGEIITIEDSPSEWIEELMISDHIQPIGVLPSHIKEDDLTELGFSKLTDREAENGLHYGQNDSPEKMAKQAFLSGDIEEIVFIKTEQSQFYVKFDMWGR